MADYFPTAKEFADWFMLRRARQDYYDTSDELYEFLEPDCDRYFAETWGIRMEHDATIGTYTVLDEQKHLLFLLKYKS